MGPFQRRGTEAPMDFAYDSNERDVYAPDSPFRPAWASGSRTTAAAPSFPVLRHNSGPSSYPGGFLGATTPGDWNSQMNSMPAPEIADISMDSVDLPPSPAKLSSRPDSPIKQQMLDSGSGSEGGALIPAPRRSSRKPANRIQRRKRRATSAPTGEEDYDSDETEGGAYRGPTSLANHYTMHLNAPGGPAAPVPWYAPHLLVGYVRVLFNTSLVLGFLYIVVVIVVTVRRDIEDKVSAYTGENAAEIQQCTSQYLLNKCGPKLKIPHMKQFCDEWERCMKRDASVVGRAKVAAETLAEVVNGFVEPITWKTLGFSISTLAFFVLFINASASLMRPRAPTEQPLQHVPQYPYPAPYAVMPPDWGTNWSDGQSGAGPKMIRGTSEVPGKGRRAMSVRR
ncbi:hypothetical protein BDV93DRAFT_484900 [Ceratobasidium sp. AG-I]|nr:hypothetical protein BDV93DRAFT_484900 [Ceratobasidium sp. AG-I]